MSDHHAFHTDMPRNTREFLAFMLVISLLSVNVIPLLISGLTVGFSFETWRGVLKVLPVLWVAVVAVVLVTMKPAQLLTGRLVHSGDSFTAHVVVNALCSVLLMSLVLTVVGTWIGTWRISAEPVTHFADLWPRNFTIAFFVETLLAQPVARLVMRRYHRHVDARTGREVDDDATVLPVRAGGR